MPRWITFDEPTADALRSRQIEADAVWPDLDPLSEALRRDAAVVMMPAEGTDVLVARVRRAAQPAAANFEVARWTDDDAVGYTAGGMLGLLDEPVYQEEEPAKKKWWRRILE